jgi:hypothetical protein
MSNMNTRGKNKAQKRGIRSKYWRLAGDEKVSFSEGEGVIYFQTDI